MKIKEITETASSGASSAAGVATVVNPRRKPKKQKPTDNALDMKNASLFGGKLIKR